MSSSPTQERPLHSAIQRMVDLANQPTGRRNGIPTGATMTCAAAAHDEPCALVGMPADTLPHAEMLWGGAELIADASLLVGMGGGRARMRDTALYIEMGVVLWQSGGPGLSF